MSDKLARKRAELALLEAEEAFREKKAGGEVAREDKLALRELRQSFRDEYRQPVSEGAAPAAIKPKADPKASK
jgi:hypothetical protein